MAVPCELEELVSIARPVFLPCAMLILASVDISARAVVDSILPIKNKIVIKISGNDVDWGSTHMLR